MTISLFLSSLKLLKKQTTMKKQSFAHRLKNLAKKFKSITTILLLYISIAGLYTFTAFILEEAQQQVIWGTWPARDAKNWALVYNGCQILRSMNRSLKILNWTIGYIQPLALLSYHSYWKSTDYYIRSLEAVIMKQSPRCFAGKNVELLFTPEKITQEDGVKKLIGYNIIVVVDYVPEKFPAQIEGVGKLQGKYLIIDMREK